MKLFVVEKRLREQVVAALEYAMARELFGYEINGYWGVELHDASVGGHHLDHLGIQNAMTSSDDPFKHTVPHCETLVESSAP